MKIRIYKFSFKSDVHFGDGYLNQSNCVFKADTLFSALCIEAIKQDRLNELVCATQNGEIYLSDSFPFKEKSFYLPKPTMQIRNAAARDPKQRKKFNKLKYLPMEVYESYLNGSFNIEKYDDHPENPLGKELSFTKVAVRNNTDDTLPYHVGAYRFNNGNGLYVIALLDDSKVALLDELFKALSFSGIGGKLSSGFGRFNLEIVSTERFSKVEQKLLSHIGKKSVADDSKKLMLLSCALPQEAELETAMIDATYSFEKRSGFVFGIGGEGLKKKDLYVFGAGSCFKNSFTGDIYNVSRGSSHPVYRYAKALFMEVQA